MTGHADTPRGPTAEPSVQSSRPGEAGNAQRLRQAVATVRDHPGLPTLIPSLPPGILVRLYDVVGLHDAGALMALTPPALLNQALEEAVWSETDTRSRFDTDALVDWLEVWNAEGEGFVADQLAALDEDMLALCFSELVHVQDSHATAFCRDPEAHDGDFDGAADQRVDDAMELLEPGPFTETFDRFLVAPRQDDEWDVVRDALLALWIHHPERLRALLTRLTPDSSAGAGTSARQVLHDDVSGAREHRRERAGFVPVSAARGFLALAATMPVADLIAMTSYDPESGRALRRLTAPGAGTTPTPTPPAADAATSGAEAAAAAPDLWSALAAAGVIDAASPAGLLGGPASPTPAPLLRQYLDDLAASDSAALEHTAAELAYLANVVLAGVTLHGDRREAQARELAYATASLGIELLEARGHTVRLGEPPGLIRPFLLAWRTLNELPRRIAEAFESALAAPTMDDHLASRHWLRAQTEEALDDLQSAVRTRRLDAAREAVGLLSLAFATDACRAIVHLLGQPPRFPALLDGGHKDDARWIQSRRDLERVRSVLAHLQPKA